MSGPLKRAVHREAVKEASKRQKVDELVVRAQRLRCLSTSSSSSSDNDTEVPHQLGIIEHNEIDVPSDFEQVCERHLSGSEHGSNADEHGDDGDLNEQLLHVSENEAASDAAEDPSSPDSDSDGPVDVNVAFRNDAEKQEYMIDTVREWASAPGVLSMTKVDDLLHRLRPLYPLMPLSYKTLFECSYDFDITVLDAGGEFWYKGIAANLLTLDLRPYLLKHGKIVLDVNMDGLPISKSPPRKFWPILAYLVHTNNEPFIVAVYFNSHDPETSADLMGKFVDELEVLYRDGFVFEGVAYEVQVRHYILDAPARELVKGCKGHGGYEACEKCSVYGEWIDNRMTYVDLNQPLRTDESFRLRTNPRHHVNNYGDPPLERINTRMVSQFRLDPMHLIYAGVFKHLLKYWLTVPGCWKIHHEVVGLISQMLLFLKPTCPSDFNRKPGRPLGNFSNMKCTELRRLLLYDGILVFKGMVDDNVYKHFLLLHCCIFILSSPVLVLSERELARELARTFITHSVRIYGARFVVYNVHSLAHLPDECEENGMLEDFSAFKYENRLKSIKEKLRSGNKPLQQLARRDAEQSKSTVVLKSDPVRCVLSKKRTVPNEIIAGDQFRKLSVGSVVFNLNGSDICFKTKKGDTVLLKNIVRRAGKVYFVGSRFLRHEDFFEYPVPSSRLGIFKVSHQEDRRRAFPWNSVECKCWLMPDGDAFLCVPILHTFNCFN